MKTAVMIGSHGLEAFRPDLLEHPDEVRFVGMFTEPDAAQIPAPTRAFLQTEHLVPTSLPDPGRLMRPQVSPAAAEAVIGNLLRDTPAQQVTLHCQSERNMLIVARLRERFGIRGPRRTDIAPYRDKLLMKRILQDAGIRVPAFGAWEPGRYAADPPGYFEHIGKAVGVPFILKPARASGGEGVFPVASFEEFAALPQDLGTGGEDAEYEYEEFLRGTMHSVNIISAGGRTLFAGASQYLVRSATTTPGLVNADMNLPDGDPRVAPMVAFAERALHALGRLDGACHMELFHTPDGELVFLEVGARFKGLAGLTAMQRHYGRALANTVFAIESGISSRPYDADRTPCFDAAFLLRRGVAARLVPPDVESRFEMRWKVRPGQRVDVTGELGGTFLLWNESEEALHRDFIRLADYRPVVYA
ncbi:acetyl-CoA carboxylase biotin carboxylase subunit family protein [Streptomyces sp. NPDC093249]|uniref:ATP-grasp domain-containing protein n=1 Tax=unclassified Streptomyces TaxID=2593676 RepID=UPI003819F2DA